MSASLTSNVPGIDELVDRADALAPAIRERARDTEEARSLPAATIAELKAAGLFRLMQPGRYGGYEHGFDALVRVTGPLARACGSTGWVYSVGAFHGWNVGLFPEHAQDDVWGETPDALSASSYVPAGTAEPAGDGLKVSGRWPFASGCDHFDWIILGARVPDEPDPRFCLVPKAEFEIVDDWHVVGLAGTGSKSVVVEEAFVPNYRTLSFDAARRGESPGGAVHEAAIYRMPFFAASSSCLIGPGLGIAHGVVEDFIEEIRSREVRSVAGVASTMADHLTIQMRVAEASGLVDAATLLILRDCVESQETVAAGKDLDMVARARNKRDQALAIKFCKDAVQRVMDAVGANGLRDDRSIQRAWRDLQAVSAHITLNWDILMPAHGRVLLGREPGVIL